MTLVISLCYLSDGTVAPRPCTNIWMSDISLLYTFIFLMFIPIPMGNLITRRHASDWIAEARTSRLWTRCTRPRFFGLYALDSGFYPA
ncbi:hypothetical protein B0T22DRAFT_163336 [Podospora appendiculata]|uniref:Uncharacterized protein n=1 Tax=Podospora appendiculata TaxID=314037 RepID=A0AAE0XA37_9PEZI|nr:hypothetical protein B0T22DRAFT_163336 [Podospora appendiculata]